MTLRSRFTFLSSVTFGFFSIIFSFILFILFYSSTKKLYFKHLNDTALLSGIYYLEKDEMPEYKYEIIREEYKSSISEHMVAVYDRNDKVVYGRLTDDKNIKPSHINEARKKHSVEFTSNHFFYYGISYHDNQGNFVVFVKTSVDGLYNEMLHLLVIILGITVVGLFGIFLISKYLSHIIYNPINSIVEAVNEASYHDIAKAITPVNSNDEIGKLIKSYNKLLGRISENIIIQKNFINYVSHEFKTPLMSISGNLEVFSLKDRSPKEYTKVVKLVLDDVYKLESILNNLLLMSKLRSQDSTQYSKIRIDEIIWDIYKSLSAKVLEQGSEIKVYINVSNPSFLLFFGSETLIYLALYNIIENAVKYSPKSTIKISLSLEDSTLKMLIEDSGIGMSSNDTNRIFDPFYRGGNVNNIQGTGIGMALVKNILDHHNIQIHVKSVISKGTKIYLSFP
ncbi:sensor histidine kinase [Elizabethkingia anophelis]|uniref:HAMP domain-containing sensor histidine kinase n=1 Tax=Elizabethkingia anophelis TaxID=1117645 RepID=UPI0013698C69|nr:HAMP domain-containing sensor histidine kinase [Elizabethkingia anophelis]MYY49929.1 sensor histidine kinase [Elizabethkingia anophelis]